MQTARGRQSQPSCFFIIEHTAVGVSTGVCGHRGRCRLRCFSSRVTFASCKVVHVDRPSRGWRHCCAANIIRLTLPSNRHQQCLPTRGYPRYSRKVRSATPGRPKRARDGGRSSAAAAARGRRGRKRTHEAPVALRTAAFGTLWSTVVFNPSGLASDRRGFPTSGIERHLGGVARRSWWWRAVGDCGAAAAITPP